MSSERKYDQLERPRIRTYHPGGMQAEKWAASLVVDLPGAADIDGRGLSLEEAEAVAEVWNRSLKPEGLERELDRPWLHGDDPRGAPVESGRPPIVIEKHRRTLDGGHEVSFYACGPTRTSARVAAIDARRLAFPPPPLKVRGFTSSATLSPGWLVSVGNDRFWFDKALWDRLPEAERMEFLTELLRSRTEDGLQQPVTGFQASSGLRVNWQSDDEPKKPPAVDDQGLLLEE